LSYVFVATMIRSTAGEDGMKFFALVYCIFMFILVANLISIIPYTFTVMSHIIVTASFALLVFFTVLIYGLYKNGLKFFKIFVPSGVPMYILPLVVAIEIISFLSRPLSHSVRLFANMLAGHITLKVFAGFVAMLGTSLGAVGWIGGMVPLALTVALTALELLVAFLQALRVCDPDLHLSQRCAPRGTLRDTREPRQFGLQRRTYTRPQGRSARRWS
jgi:F-type H+-transporting ATPase subunit a